ncbi:MAG: DMT family transporter [Desulfuromonadales bacterium]|nr:DMT family transporter [Desulfuromonadales bacterium]
MSKTFNVSGSSLAGFGFATGSAFAFALLNVTIRYCGPYLTVWQMVFARSVFGVIAMLLLARFSGISLWGRGRKTLLLAGVTSVINVVCLMSAILLLPLFEALVLLYLYPLFAALISPVISGDQLSKGDWAGIAVGLTGAFLVLWPEQVDARLSLGHVLGLLAAFSYGLSMTLIRRVVGVNNPLVPFFYISLVGCVVCALPALWPITSSGHLPVQGWAGLSAVVVLTAIAYLACIKALAYLPSPQVGVISTSEVVFSAVFGLWLFNEPLGKLAFTGGALILAGGLFLSMKRQPLPR